MTLNVFTRRTLKRNSLPDRFSEQVFLLLCGGNQNMARKKEQKSEQRGSEMKHNVQGGERIVQLFEIPEKLLQPAPLWPF